MARPLKRGVSFGLWAAVGAGLVLGAVSLGPLSTLPALALAGVLVYGAGLRAEALGALAGIGLVLLFVAYRQREGPGTICRSSPGSVRCDSYLDPKPWLVVGILFVVAGVVTYVARR